MITDIAVANIFRPRNDWDINILRSKKIYHPEKIEIELARIIKKETGFSPYDNTRYRGRLQCRSRQIFLTMMNLYTAKSLESIGSLLNKDHATVLSAIKAVGNQCDTDKRFKALFDRIDIKAKELK
jgi:hypothetical protein